MIKKGQLFAIKDLFKEREPMVIERKNNIQVNC
jgi:hypothetical protein